MSFSPLDTLCINTIRTLSMDAIQKANSGHPGLPMGAAPMAYVLWRRHLRHAPKHPGWADRDRFVLSAGHGSMLLYSLLHLTGYDVTLEDIKNFRQWGGKTPGHPESFITPGVEATTGPLGQGTANAVGMAMAERALAHRYNRPGHVIVDHHTYVLAGDGDLMEGLSAEAASLAGHLKLGKLIMLYDANDISLDGPLSLSFTEDVGARYAAHGWQVLTVADGDTDLDAIDQAIVQAKSDQGRPSLIIVKTTIGYGSPNKQGKSAAHGEPLGTDEIQVTKSALNWEHDHAFHIPESALSVFREAVDQGDQAFTKWREIFEAFARDFPELASEWSRAHARMLPENWDAAMPEWAPGTQLATRAASGQALNALALGIPWLMGGDADLSCSTKTTIKDSGSFNGQTGEGRNIHFGVREHAMGSIANGMAYHRGLIPFTATFLCFADYMRPAMRLAALSQLPVIFVFTHDSIGLGEDGPTHQPVEHVASLRAMPNMLVIRPADATETAEAWRVAVSQKGRPTTLVFSRQKLPVLDRGALAGAKELRKGGYVLSDADAPRVVMIATGSEVAVALEVQRRLAAAGHAARVVSMPCCELFAEQSAAYRRSVLPTGVPRVVIEAGVSFGWERWAGDSGTIIGVDRFGASAPGDQVLAQYGLGPDRVYETVIQVING